VELAQKLLTPDQYDVLGILKYCTQEVEIYSYTGYNIHGDAYEVGFNGNAVKNNLGGTLKSGDAEAHFVTTTRAGDVFSVTVSNEDESVVAQSPRFRVVPGGIAEVVVEPQEVEIEAEHGQATFNVKGFDKYKNYKLKYCDAETFDAAYRSEDESATYEYVSTNEIVVNPLWLLESHEVEYQAAGDKYNVKNSEEVGVFSSEGRTSTNTFGAGWEHGTREVWVIDTTEAAFAHAGSKALNSNAELRYKIKSIPWNIYDKEIFALATASIIVKPLLKGYLSFRNHDDEETQALYMNAVSGKYAEDPFGVDAVDPHNGKPGKYAQDPVSSKFIIDDVLKFYVQTYSDRGQLTSADSNAEVIVQLDTAEDDLARV
ncbi:MAG TPA: hypothetical protein PKL57_21655, partial [Candidatus Wallbacteria bacterium]|nr:hypothetical protein [Candidatus Wallbacteria bacterium]